MCQNIQGYLGNNNQVSMCRMLYDIYSWTKVLDNLRHESSLRSDYILW